MRSAESRSTILRQPQCSMWSAFYAADTESTAVAGGDVREMGGIRSPCFVLKCCAAFYSVAWTRTATR